MTNPDTPPSVSQDNAIAAAMLPMQIIAETVVGYHRKLVDGGVPGDAAAAMAQEFHTTMMETIKTAQANQTAQAFGAMLKGKR